MVKLKRHAILNCATWCFLGIALYLTDNVNCAFNMTEYYQMPPLSKYENYDKCLFQYPNSTYCVVKTMIKPDASSSIWGLIQKFSDRVYTSFRHDVLDRGLCIRSCEDLLRKHGEQSDLYQEKFADISQFILAPSFTRNVPEYREKFSDLLNRCVNLELKSEFDLMGYSEIEYCVDSEDKAITEYDWLDKLFLIIVGIIVVLNCLSTAIDYKLKKTSSMDHFKTSLADRDHRWLVSFSVPRNYYRCISIKPNDQFQEFRFMDGFRFFSACSVIFHHAFLCIYIQPLHNPETVEQLHASFPAVTMDAIRFFFTQSAFILSWQLMSYHKSNTIKPNVRNYALGVFHRYIRLAPCFAFMILLHATIMPKLVDGPFWNLSSEREICRNNWWSNLLFIQNYVNPGAICVPQSWYLGSEFLMFLIGLACLFVIIKYPRTVKYIFGIGLFVSYAIVAVSVYYNEFEGTIVLPLESVRTFMSNDKTFSHNYVAPHMSFGTYFIGLFCGYIYFQLKERKINLFDYSLFRAFFYMTAPILFGLMYISKRFFLEDFEKPNLGIALYCAFARHLWSWTQCVILIGFTQKAQSSMRNFVGHPLFTTLGQLSYGLLLGHVFILKVAAGMRSVTYFNWSTVFSVLLTNLALSLGIALLLHILIELPSNTLLRNLTAPKPPKPVSASKDK